MWSGPDPPSPLLLHSCHVCVPPERKTQGKKRAEVFLLSFGYAKMRNAQTHAGTNFSQDANANSNGIKFRIRLRSVLWMYACWSFFGFLNCQHLNVKCIHSFIFTGSVSWPICIKRLTNTLTVSQSLTWLPTNPSLLLLNFKVKNILQTIINAFDSIRNKTKQNYQCWMIARAYPYLDTNSRTSFIIIIRINAERHKTHTHTLGTTPINFSFFQPFRTHTQHVLIFMINNITILQKTYLKFE